MFHSIRKFHFIVKLVDCYTEYGKDPTGRFLASLVKNVADKTSSTQSIHLESVDDSSWLDMRKVDSNYRSLFPPSYTFCWFSRPVWLRCQAAAAVGEMRNALNTRVENSIVWTSNVEAAVEGLEVKVTGYKIRVKSRDSGSQGTMTLTPSGGIDPRYASYSGMDHVLDGRYGESEPLLK